MIYKEIQGDLFSVDEKYYLAHCVSADYALGAGIATEFVKRFDMRRELQINGNGMCPDCILIGKVFNLVTKKYCYNKPTYNSLITTINYMRDEIKANGIQHLAMPRIGCGIDGLDWRMVSRIINDTFKDADIEIIVYYL